MRLSVQLFIGMCRDIPPIMQNEVQTNWEKYMKTEVGLEGVYGSHVPYWRTRNKPLIETLGFCRSYIR